MKIATYVVGILLVVVVIWQISASLHQRAAVDSTKHSTATVYPLPPPDDSVDAVYYVNTKSDKYHTRKCPIAITAADAYIKPEDAVHQSQYRKCPYCLGGRSVGSSQQQSDDAEFSVAKTRLMMSGDQDNQQVITDMTKQQEGAVKHGTGR
ncbi:MAG: hypothetical protein ACYC1M_18635 [Armatimonadota bacterium]